MRQCERTCACKRDIKAHNNAVNSRSSHSISEWKGQTHNISISGCEQMLAHIIPTVLFTMLETFYLKQFRVFLVLSFSCGWCCVDVISTLNGEDVIGFVGVRKIKHCVFDVRQKTRCSGSDDRRGLNKQIHTQSSLITSPSASFNLSSSTVVWCFFLLPDDSTVATEIIVFIAYFILWRADILDGICFNECKSVMKMIQGFYAKITIPLFYKAKCI